MTTGEKLYDALMRLPIIAFNLYFLAKEASGIRQIVALHPYFGGDWLFLFTVTARISIVMFLVTLICLFASRYRPIRKYSSWDPKITALAGTLLPYLMLLGIRPSPSISWDSLSTALLLTGNILAIVTVVALGRSLSVMPEARKLVTEGLYRRIRHPLYFAEEIAIIGVYLQFRSWQATIIVIVHLYFQIRRMTWEEQILGRAFPEYGEYKLVTHRLIPGIY